MSFTEQTQERLVDAASTAPFVSLAGYHFMSLNEFLETATLLMGFVAGMFAMFFHVRRWFRSHKRDKAIKREKDAR